MDCNSKDLTWSDRYGTSRLARWLAGAGLAILLASCRGDPESDRDERVAAPPVEAVQARRGGLPLVERLSGTVWAENQVALHPEISGRIAEVLVESGASVGLGQPLVRLRDETHREQLRQAEAGYRINEARRRQARARLAELEAQASRTRTLGERKLVSDLELETTAAQVESAGADVALAEAQLEQAAATLAEQRDLLDRTVVRAPIAGVVGQRNAEVGMQVTSSTALFTIGNVDRLEVRVDISDNMLRHIEVGQPVRILVESAAGEITALPARLSRVSPFLNDVTRSAEGEISIDNADRRLRPGMFVPVDIFYGQSQQATLVPVSALFLDANTGREGIFVAGGMPSALDAAELAPRDHAPDAKAPPTGQRNPLTLTEPRPVEFRPIGVIARGEHEVAIDTLQPGDWVVTLGQDLLSRGREQARVRAVSWEHVIEMQDLKREDLLGEILRPATPGPGSPDSNL